MTDEEIQKSNPYVLCIFILSWLIMEIIKLVINKRYQSQRLKHLKDKEKSFSNSEN